ERQNRAGPSHLPDRYDRRGGLLPARRHPAVRAARDGQGRVTRRGHRRNEARSGLRPETRHGALPPGPPPEAQPLDSIRFDLEMGGGPAPPSAAQAPLPSPNQRKGSKGGAVGGSPEGSALWWGPGAK